MKSSRPILILLIASVSIFPLVGCARFIHFAHYTDPAVAAKSHSLPLLTHRSPLVRYPTIAGSWLGAAAGLPVEIPYFLVLVPINAMRDVPFSCASDDTFTPEYEEGAILGGPMVVTGAIGETALGAPCWALFGWWWPHAHGPRPKPEPEQESVIENTEESK